MHPYICKILNFVAYIPFKYNKTEGLYGKSKGLHIYSVIFAIILTTVNIMLTITWMTRIGINRLYLVDSLFIYNYHAQIIFHMIIFTYYMIFRSNELMRILNSIHLCCQEIYKLNKRRKLCHIFICLMCELILIPIGILTIKYFNRSKFDVNRIEMYLFMSTLITTWNMGTLLPFFLYMLLIIELLNGINFSLENISENSKLKINDKRKQINSISEIYYKIHKNIIHLTQFYSLLICSYMFNIILFRIWHTYRVLLLFDQRNTSHSQGIVMFKLEFIIYTAAFLKTMFYLFNSANLIYETSQRTKIILSEMRFFDRGFGNSEITNSVSYRNCEIVERCYLFILIILVSGASNCNAYYSY